MPSENSEFVDTIGFDSSGFRENPSIPTLVAEYGRVYVSSLTRDGCSGCAEQKPLFRELAAKLTTSHGSRVRFSNVHVRYSRELQKDSWESKRVFGHAAYPTYLIHVKSQVGPLEVYRAIYPSMEEVEKQVVDAIELADYYKSEAEKQYPSVPVT